MATFNVENLDPGDGSAKFASLADLIVDNLRSPDLIALEEIQDNTGPVNDSTVNANLTLDLLVDAISAAGGPAYSYRQIDPVNNSDGGEPGGNIRVGFIFRTDRGLSFVDRPGGNATSATGVVAGAGGAELTFSPGRIDPTNPAFNNSRKPLAGEFRWRGKTIFAIANHFNSKGGDDPLFGRFQPPTRFTETQRHAQAQVVNDFVDAVLARRPGRLRDRRSATSTTSSSPRRLSILQGGVLDEPRPHAQAGRAVHVRVRGQLAGARPHPGEPQALRTLAAYDVVHVNAEFADQASDHDPQVARFSLGN